MTLLTIYDEHECVRVAACFDEGTVIRGADGLEYTAHNGYWYPLESVMASDAGEWKPGDPPPTGPVPADPPGEFSETMHDPDGTVAGGILGEARTIVEGVRGVTHGDKERSFEMIADLWNAYLGITGAITAFDVAQMMVLLKMARANCGTRHRDHFVDQCGYSAIAGELA